MLSIRSSRPCNVMFFVAILTVIVTGCGGGTVEPAVTSASSATSTPPATSSATAASPKTVSEVAWIAGIKALERKMTDAAMGGGSGVVTSKWMRDASKQLGGCTAELSRLGPATDKEQVVFVAAKQGCARYEEAARCLASGKADSPDLGKCFDPMNRGAELFATAGAAAEIIH